MTAKPYPTNLTDAEWELIKDLIPPAKPGGRHRALDMRAVVNAIFYVVDGGIKWRMLPHDYPKWPSVYWYFRQWRDSGDWQRIHDTLRKLGQDMHYASAEIKGSCFELKICPNDVLKSSKVAKLNSQKV
jgi:putative transposase